jgi:hypothetical protein
MAGHGGRERGRRERGGRTTVCSWKLDVCLGRLWRSTLMHVDVATLVDTTCVIAARRSDTIFAST